jgi:hypothetical protein
MLEQPLKFLVVFFVVVEPISLVTLFSGLTRGATRECLRRMAIKAVVGREIRLTRTPSYIRRNSRSHTRCPSRSPRRSKRVGDRSAGRGTKPPSRATLRSRGSAARTASISTA